jgi:serine/threonine-protein kinase RsbW
MEASKLIIPSETAALHKVEQFIEEISDQYNIFSTYYANILMAVTEAVKNAMQHGNGWDASKKVSISFESSESGLLFTVTDEGKGFDFNAVPDPTDPETEYETAGTGIFLIKSLSDEVMFRNQGREVYIRFDISSINQKVYQERMTHFKNFVQAGTHVSDKERS